MDSRRWSQVKRVFEDALAVPEHERSEYLRRTCGSDRVLRTEVESLLHSLSQSGGFLEPPRTETAGSLPPDPNIGRRFGAYRVERLVGHGGMGAVYEATRDDGEFVRQVAIKLIRPAALSKELVERFHHERQTLAHLEHPNIAGLLDGGTTEDGIPYLVMEFVHGVPIDVYCDSHSLTVEERLGLFQTVCAAVQTAHQSLVVHRDIKPGNILVATNGMPKLLDFGIAKFLNEAQEAEPGEATRVGLRFITPEYASPEQIRGEPVTTASDVYALGVLLYKLLTGRSPYQFRSRLPHDMTRTICEESPLKPSTSPQKVPQTASGDGSRGISALRGLTPEKLRRRLSGDLDTILLKALQKDPQRRYHSVEQFSEDIRRHLHGLPVLARPDTIGYRAAKFVRRHGIGVVATAFVLLAVIGGVIGVVWQANKAQREAAKAEQINVFLREMLASADPAKSGKDVTVRQALDAAVVRIDKELDGQPEIAASVLHTIGETYISLGMYDKATAQLEKALHLREDVFGSEHEDISTVFSSLAYVAQLTGDYTRADSLYRRAIRMHRRLHPEPDRHIAAMVGDYGTLLLERRAMDSAIVLLKESVDLCRDVYGRNSKEYATALSNFGPALFGKHQLAAAESVFQIALPVMRKILGNEHIDVAQAENNLAFVLIEKNDTAGAEELFHHSLQIRRSVLGKDHPEVALGLLNLGALRLRSGHVADAETLIANGLQIFRNSLRPDNVRLSSALLLYGRLLDAKGEPVRAESFLREALAIRKKSFPPGGPAVAVARSELGYSLLQQRRYPEAGALLEEAYADLSGVLGETHASTQEALGHLTKVRDALAKKDRQAR